MIAQHASRPLRAYASERTPRDRISRACPFAASNRRRGTRSRARARFRPATTRAHAAARTPRCPRTLHPHASRAVTKARTCRSPGRHAGATCAAAATSASPRPFPPTTCSRPRVRYAIRVSTREPPQRGNAICGRASDQCTSPLPGSIAASWFVVAADDEEPVRRPRSFRQSPSRRFDPSAATTHVPPPPLTSRRPGAGRRKSAGAACSTPIVRRTASTTARPGGENAAAATTAASTANATDHRSARRAAHRLVLRVRGAHHFPRPLLGVAIDGHSHRAAASRHAHSLRNASSSRSSATAQP